MTAAERASGWGFCFTWDLAGGKERGRAVGTDDLAGNGRLTTPLSKTCFPLEFQVSLASALVTMLGNFCPPSGETEVRAEASGQSDGERRGLGVQKSPISIQTLCNCVASDAMWFPL